MAVNVRRGANVFFRARVGLVLLDMANRKCDAVELYSRHGGWNFAATGVSEEFYVQG